MKPMSKLFTNRIATVRLACMALLVALFTGCGDRMPIRGGEQEAQRATAAAELAEASVDLAHFGYPRGSAMAPVVVIEFSDFGCPYCARFALETLPEIDAEYIETGQVRWQYVPFVMGMFPNGEEAARASECAADQQAFWPMHDLIYERQREWRGTGAAEPLFVGYAERLELDVAEFAACYRENRPAERIARSNAVAQRLGVQATPSFLVNGRPVQGALPLEQFRMLIEWAAAGGGAQ
jgi:protein-disulfide isomerase